MFVDNVNTKSNMPFTFEKTKESIRNIGLYRFSNDVFIRRQVRESLLISCDDPSLNKYVDNP